MTKLTLILSFLLIAVATPTLAENKIVNDVTKLKPVVVRDIIAPTTLKR